MKQMTPYERFKNECRLEIEAMGSDRSLYQKSQDWRNAARQYKYSYHFEWLGRPIIQYPQDIIAMQELVWTVKPDLIIETGIAHGGFACHVRFLARPAGYQRVDGIRHEFRSQTILSQSTGH